MTVKELSGVRKLDREIERDKYRLEELEARAAVPERFRRYRGKSGTAGLDELKNQIAELQGTIMEKETRRIQEMKRLFLFAAAARDSYTRLIFELHFVDGKSWEETADIMEGKPESMRKYCCRYLKAHPDLHLE